MSRFPSIVYRSPGAHFGPPVEGKSTTYDSKGVDNEMALKAALDAGWCLSLGEAVAGKAPAPAAPVVDSGALADKVEKDLRAVFVSPAVADVIEDAPDLSDLESEAADGDLSVEATDEFRPSRADLESRAKDLGLTFGNRISDANLQARIDHALSLTEKKG